LRPISPPSGGSRSMKTASSVTIRSWISESSVGARPRVKRAWL
jgi:hypothetical protein